MRSRRRAQTAHTSTALELSVDLPKETPRSFVPCTKMLYPSRPTHKTSMPLIHNNAVSFGKSCSSSTAIVGQGSIATHANDARRMWYAFCRRFLSSSTPDHHSHVSSRAFPHSPVPFACDSRVKAPETSQTHFPTNHVPTGAAG